MNLETPKGLRLGQSIFNFLWWLHKEKGYSPEDDSSGSRMADPFHIPDEEFIKLYKEFLKQYDTQR